MKNLHKAVFIVSVSSVAFALNPPETKCNETDSLRSQTPDVPSIRAEIDDRSDASSETEPYRPSPQPSPLESSLQDPNETLPHSPDPAVELTEQQLGLLRFLIAAHLVATENTPEISPEVRAEFDRLMAEIHLRRTDADSWWETALADFARDVQNRRVRLGQIEPRTMWAYLLDLDETTLAALQARSENRTQAAVASAPSRGLHSRTGSGSAAQ